MRVLKSVAAAAAIFLLGVPAQAAEIGTPLLFDSQGRLAVNAFVNETGPYLFAVDTAAQVSMIGAEVIDAVGLEPDPDNKAQLHGAGGAQTVNLYPVASLRVGPMERRDLLLPEPAHERESDALGLIGADFFRGSKIEFDLGGARFSVTEGDGPLESGFEILPAQQVMGVFTVIEVKIDGVEATAIVDTGALNTMGNMALFAALGLADDDPRITRDTRPIGVTGDAVDFRDGFTGAVSFGNATFASAPVSFAALPVFRQFGLSERPAIILGLDTLKLLNAFSIDYATARFAVKTPPH